VVAFVAGVVAAVTRTVNDVDPVAGTNQYEYPGAAIPGTVAAVGTFVNVNATGTASGLCNRTRRNPGNLVTGVHWAAIARRVNVAFGVAVPVNADGADVPAVFEATTRNRYAVPFASPVTVHDDPVVTHVNPPGVDVTV
jgi:hypothetical protein